MGLGQGSPSETVSHAIYHPPVYKLLLLVHEVHLKRFYEKQHDLPIWHKDNLVDKSDSVILSKPIILLFLLNSSHWSSWKTLFFGDFLGRDTLYVDDVFVDAG